MSLVNEAIVFVLVSLIVINGLIGGGVVDAIGTFATEDEKQQARLDLMCGVGYLLYAPTTDVYGFQVPSPSITNLFVAALISMSFILIIRITTGIKWNFKYTIITFIGVWIAIKILGHVLMVLSGETCTTWATESIEKTSGFYDVAAIGGSLWFLKIIWSMRK